MDPAYLILIHTLKTTPDDTKEILNLFKALLKHNFYSGFLQGLSKITSPSGVTKMVLRLLSLKTPSDELLAGIRLFSIHLLLEEAEQCDQKIARILKRKAKILKEIS